MKKWIFLFTAGLFILLGCSKENILESDITIIETTLQNVALDEGATRVEVDLSGAFAVLNTKTGNYQDRDINKSIALNSNTALLSATIDQDNLILDIEIGQTGSAAITILARVPSLEIEDTGILTVTVSAIAVTEAVNIAIQNFQSGNYEEAEIYFLVAISKNAGGLQSEAYMGLGFSRMRLGKAEVDYGYVALQTSLALDPANLHAKGGLSLLEYSVKQNYMEAIRYGDELLTADGNWIFKYDTSLDKNDIMVNIALSQFSAQLFDDCLATILLLDPVFGAQSSDSDFQAQLLQKLALLIGLYGV